MKKILCVASREFTATVMTKGFLFGLLLMPAIIVLSIVLIPRLMNQSAPKIEGQVAMIDPTGEVADSVSDYLSPQRFAERRAETQNQIGGAALKATGVKIPINPAMQKSLNAALGEVPRIACISLKAGANLETEKSLLKRTLPKQTGNSSGRLAIIVVHPDAVRLAEGKSEFGTYDLFVRDKLDDRILSDIHAGLRESIIAARFRLSDLDPKRIYALTTVKRPESKTVTLEGEHASNMAFNAILPLAFMFLLWIAVFSGGQSLLTTTIEEKSNRVVEILLSAVSAMELMTGKILGQMAVGLIILALYAGLGIIALASFAMIGLLDPKLFVFLLVFFFLAYFTIASLMAAIGSAVSEIRDAQGLMTPMMLILMIPMFLWMPISRDPNSLFAVVLSFVPPIGNFTMLLRMTSNTPPAMWQAWASVLVNAAGACGAIWFASKVFRIGLLMYGKPPNIGTLIRWARMS